MIYTLPHIIEHSASLFPDNIAFKCNEKSFTYHELNSAINQLANILIAKGVQKGDRVGIYLNRSIETPVAIYGIMRAGGVYVPLDPTAPSERTKLIIEDCGIKQIVSNNSLERVLRKVVEKKTILSALIGVHGEYHIDTISWQEVSQASSKDPNINLLEQDLAYIMYTSGSTGVPKGIMHTHYSGLSYAKLSSELYALSPEDRIANHAPLHFDISTFGYFSAPFSCSTTIIIPDAYTKMPASLTQLIEKERITIWYSVPIAITQMLLMGAIERRDLSSLRWVLWGGEVFPTKYVRTWMEKFPQSKMSNVYGPAEVNQCTYYHLEKPPREGETVPLGVPWGNTEILVLDGNDTPVEPTEVGELLVRSATRMKGYWKQEKLTASRFYLKDLDSGLTYTYYRTGDLVKYNDDGLLEFMGRKDRQVKIRGYRVELDEIVATILQHKDVEETAVFTITNAESQLQILAHVKKHHESQLTDQELYQFIKNKIPKYALPKKIIFVNDFPRTSSGKINNIELTLNANKKVNNND